jgi:serine/threonine protein kinase
MQLIKNYLIDLSDDPEKNLLEFEGKYYEIDWLGQSRKIIHGGNGVIYKLVDPEDGEEYVIKYCRYSYEEARDNWVIEKRVKRFEREIEALGIARENGLENVIDMKFHGEAIISDNTIRFYVMDLCDCNLKEYLNNPKNSITSSQKLLLCSKILTGIKNLNEYQLYHRDIKRENILFIGNEPYVSDLGLVGNRNSEYRLNERGELIGPIGWFSPEAITKHYVEKLPNPYNLDCILNSKSDVFHLGELFWYIFQGNLPVGQIKNEDFVIKDEDLYEIIFLMLQHCKNRRPKIDEIDSSLKKLFPKYNL